MIKGGLDIGCIYSRIEGFLVVLFLDAAGQEGTEDRRQNHECDPEDTRNDGPETETHT